MNRGHAERVVTSADLSMSIQYVPQGCPLCGVAVEEADIHKKWHADEPARMLAALKDHERRNGPA